jgi:hypothetical protein
MIDKMETYRKNAPVLPRSRIPERANIKLCMSLGKADGMPSSCAAATAFCGAGLPAGLFSFEPSLRYNQLDPAREAKVPLRVSAAHLQSVSVSVGWTGGCRDAP